MSYRTPIEWAEASWNVVTGCSVVSPGCTDCYAMKLAGTRLREMPNYKGLTQDSKAGPVWNGKVTYNKHLLTRPWKWRKPKRIFVNSMGDLFHDAVHDQWIRDVFDVMKNAPQHQFLILTKRAERMASFMNWHVRMFDAEVLPNVWLGVSAENQEWAKKRIPYLLETPAAVRFVSAEPLLGPLDLRSYIFDRDALVRGLQGEPGNLDDEQADLLAGHPIDWLIVGGESGRKPRPMDAAWARDLRDQCIEAGTPFFMKQMNRTLYAGENTVIPPDLMVRQYPEAA